MGWAAAFSPNLPAAISSARQTFITSVNFPSIVIYYYNKTLMWHLYINYRYLNMNLSFNLEDASQVAIGEGGVP